MQLFITFGSNRSESVPLAARGLMRIGRSAECEIPLEDPTTSRLQVELRIDAGRVWLKDLNSRFGTFVNGVRTTECELRLGDVIGVGETTLRLKSDSTDLRTTIAPAGNRVRGVKPVLQQPVETPANDTARQKDATGRMPVPRKLVGRKFGRFEVRSLIAETERGAMLRAFDEYLRVDVALKVFAPQAMSGSNAARLQRAVETTIPLAHPHLVEVYASGRDEGLTWLASEFVDGENAAQVIRRIGIAGMLDWRQTLKAAIHVARGLDFIGTKQIVHRNISPRSILFRNNDGIVKLGDLVLAKALDDNAARLTSAGEIVGDLPYCSPEQVTGKHLDERSDQYNLGATLYALLTGHPPCEGRSIPETIEKIQSQPPEPPTRFHLAIPPSLEGLVLRTLAKRPEDRFTNAAILLRDLERVAKYLGETSLVKM